MAIGVVITPHTEVGYTILVIIWKWKGFAILLLVAETLKGEYWWVTGSLKPAKI